MHKHEVFQAKWLESKTFFQSLLTATLDTIADLDGGEATANTVCALAASGLQGEPVIISKQIRCEKKPRKAMSRQGLKLVSGINRVTIQKSKNLLFVINKPDLYESPAGDMHIVFGEAKVIIFFKYWVVREF